MSRHYSPDPRILTVADIIDEGTKRVAKVYTDYFSGGADDMITVRDNEEAFNRYKLRPRVLRDVADVDLSTTIFGQKVDAPIGFAPAAAHKLAHPEGEMATSRVAASYNIPMALSTFASESMENVAAQGETNPYIMQVTLFKDLNVARRIIKRAEAAGYAAIFVSVDLPVLGTRPNETRNKFAFPTYVDFPNLKHISEEGESEVTAEGLLDYDASMTWEKAVKWLRSQTSMHIWLKGSTSPRIGFFFQIIPPKLYTSDDVELAIEHGLDGAIISNHGGRQLDGVPATLDALRECAAVANGRIPIGFDGGIRRGSDIFKAIALGADFCFLGRVPIWGLAYNGQAGVDLAVNLLIQGFKRTMMLCGCRTLADIKKAHLSVLAPDGVLSKL